MENAKVYVDVLVNFDKDGTMSPVDFIWEDGKNIMWTVFLQGSAVLVEKQVEPEFVTP